VPAQTLPIALASTRQSFSADGWRAGQLSQLTDLSNVRITTAIHDRGAADELSGVAPRPKVNTLTKVPSVVVGPARMLDRRIGYLLMRLAVGVSLFGHGLVRIPKLGSFHAHLTGDFAHSILPKTLVSVAGYALPFVEFCVGAMLVVGLLTKLALIAGVLGMTALVFGSTTIEDYSVIGEQLIHAAILVALIVSLEHNTYSVDRVLFGTDADAHTPADRLASRAP
jgi:thiosulfate dehydrogenase (quinone) large subunit